MILSIDNLLAAIITTVVTLVLLSTQQRSQAASVERNQFYAARRAQVSFVELLERDLHNAYAFASVNGSGADSSFAFDAILDSAHTQRGRITYRLRRAGAQGTVPVYRVERRVLVGGVERVEGWAIRGLTGWTIQAQSADGATVARGEDARQVRVHFESTSPLGVLRNETGLAGVGTIHWEATYRPSILRLRTAV